MASPWELWLDDALASLAEAKLLRSLRPLFLQRSSLLSPRPSHHRFSPSLEASSSSSSDLPFPAFIGDVETFESPGPWDRSAVEMEISRPTLQRWLDNTPTLGDESGSSDLALEHASGLNAELSHKMILFSGNDYLGLSAHPSVRRAASKAAMHIGMGPRGSALICGYTYYHRSLESALANLKKTEECLLCPTGFAANLAVMTAITSAIPHSSSNETWDDSVAIFSDALNHASIIDGIRLSCRQGKTEFHVYRHCDMEHLNGLLANCKHARKVVVTDSLFSMDGDFAPMIELVALRKRYKFLLVVDDAHGTLLCGETGGGVAEEFNVEGECDLVVGTLSKAIGCQGGFIACSRKWKQLIISRGRSFIFSTAIPVPVVAAAHTAILIAQEERWRQRTVWERVRQFTQATGFHFHSPIAPIIIGSEEDALVASRSLMMAGFHVIAIRPPTVPKDSSRLRITLTAAHTSEDVNALSASLEPWIKRKQFIPPQLMSKAGNIEIIKEKNICSNSYSMMIKEQVSEDMRAKL